VKIVSIDPSINDVGWAVCSGLERDSDGVWDDSKADWRWGCWKIRSNSLSFKLREIVEWMIVEFDGLDPDVDILILEWPQFFDAERGHIAAQQGHTINLAAVDAYIAGFFRMRPENYHLIRPSEWKGNLSKEITRKRFFRNLGIKQIYTVDHNAVDAVMLLLRWCKDHHVTLKIVSATMLREYQEG
jgi:hypothetical protein